MLTCLLFIFGFGSINAQIKWDGKRLLTWKDFSAPIDTNSLHYANTATSINYQYHVHYHDNTYTLTFEVGCVFLPKKSWCRPYKQTDGLLQHEQLHFDMEELFARKLMATFTAKIFTADYMAEVKKIYDSIAKEANKMQKEYDLETDFSEIKKEQLRWEKLVHGQLRVATGF